MIMCVLLCYPVSIHIYYKQGVLFLVFYFVIPELAEISHPNKNFCYQVNSTSFSSLRGHSQIWYV